MKLLIRFFLSFCFFLLMGFTHPGARTFSKERSAASISALEQIHTRLCHTKKNNHLLFRQAPTDKKEKSNTELTTGETGEEEEENENNEEDQISFKKYEKTLHHTGVFLTTQDPSCFRSYIQNRLSSGKHFHNTSSCRYILFRVIRV